MQDAKEIDRAPRLAYPGAMQVIIRKHSLTLAGHRTSVSLEPAFWRAFQDCAQRGGVSVNALAEHIDAVRLRSEQGGQGAMNLSAAIRLHVLEDLQARLRAATE